MLLDVLSFHEDLGWISDQVNERPWNTRSTRWNRMYDIPFIGETLELKKRLFNHLPKPVEPWKFWSHYLPGFETMRASQPILQDKEVTACRQVVGQLLRMQSKKRLLSKYTDFPRIHTLRKVFPDAMFIHLHRDPGSVSVSYAKRMMRGEFGTWENREEWLKLWPENWRDEWRAGSATVYGFSAGLTRIFTQAIQTEVVEAGKECCVELDYNDICRDPMEQISGLLRELSCTPFSRRIYNRLKREPLLVRTSSWTDGLKVDEVQDVEMMLSISFPSPSSINDAHG